jgi:hypothetical protein
VQKFKYLGQVNSGATLQLEGGESLEVLFFKGKEVELPADHPYTETLVAQGLLETVPTEEEPKSSKNRKQEKAESES